MLLMRTFSQFSDSNEKILQQLIHVWQANGSASIYTFARQNNSAQEIYHATIRVITISHCSILIQCLQPVQDTAARMIIRRDWHQHVTPN